MQEAPSRKSSLKKDAQRTKGGSHNDSVWRLRLHFSQIVTFFNMRTKNDFCLPGKSSILEDLPKQEKKRLRKKENG